MQSIQTLTNHFLIAMPSLFGSTFSCAVIYVCEHTKNGTIGIIINHPLPHLSLHDVFEQVDIKSEQQHVNDMAVLYGGPVQEDRGFVLHTPVLDGQWQSTIQISDHISVTTSRDVLEGIAQKQGPFLATIALGYAGWEPGQVEQELGENSWLVAPANDDIIFSIPFAERWRAAGALIGVNMDAVSGEIGHA